MKIHNHEIELIKDEANQRIICELAEWGNPKQFHVSTAQVRYVIEALFEVIEQISYMKEETPDEEAV